MSDPAIARCVACLGVAAAVGTKLTSGLRGFGSVRSYDSNIKTATRLCQEAMNVAAIQPIHSSRAVTQKSPEDAIRKESAYQLTVAIGAHGFYGPSHFQIRHDSLRFGLQISTSIATAVLTLLCCLIVTNQPQMRYKFVRTISFA